MVFTKSKRVCKSFISNQVFNEYPKKLKGDRRRIIFILYKNREEEATEKVISRKGSNQKKPAE